jgi:RimJ/RimL family protein N-acetyltransferase
VLKGERVSLRALASEDAAVLWRWHLDHEFSVLDGVLYPSSLSVWEAFVRCAAEPSFQRIVLGIETEGGRLVGYISLKRTASEDRRADFGIAIERDSWDKGYGADATRTLLRFAFIEMNLHRVSLGVLDSNLRAQRSYQKCAFREEGRLREHRFRNGRWCDQILMGVLDREFLEIDRASQTGLRKQEDTESGLRSERSQSGVGGNKQESEAT